jgi:Abnormal spindle-like microcephaly-assoc'd, ASPM-SPD-2-Hydin
VSGLFQGLNSKGNRMVSIPLSGTGTASGQLTLSPTSIAFGNVTVGSNSTTTGSLGASGASVTVTSAASSNSEFALTGISLPTTIAAGKSVAYSVTFTPQSSGTASGTLSFASSASKPPVAEALTGTGVSPQQYTVSLSWDASPSQVAGYNIYRGTTSGGPYTKINSTLDSVTTYTDSTVSASQTYYYVTTAVNSSGQQSAYSNQVQVVVP